MKSDDPLSLLDNLKCLLEKQIEMFRKSDFVAVEALAVKADLAIRKINKSEEFGQQFDKRCENLIKSYKTLELMIEAGKDAVTKQLRQVENGKKTLQKYRSNA